MTIPIKVKELAKFCNELVKKGYGEKFCAVTTDEEGNDWRPMWYKPTEDPERVKELMEYSQSGLSGQDPKNFVMFG